MVNSNGAPTLFAGIPGAQQMGSNSGPGGVNWLALEAVFEYACESVGVDWGEGVSLEQASHLRKLARDYALDEKVERVQGWFENWYLYYPFVDQVAVDRAVDFDPKVWDTLTARERYEVIVALAKHPDPWAENSYIGGGRGHAGVTGRAARWLQFSKEERKPLFQAVGYMRENL